MNEDLLRERSRATFNVKELTAFLNHGQKNVDDLNYLEGCFAADPVFDESQDSYLSEEETYDLSGKRTIHFLKKAKQLELDKYPYHVRGRLGGLLPPNLLALHNSMFKDAVQRQGNDDQIRKWMPLINNYQILGTYAQTEVGHGTFIRGLETTATYDPDTQMFTLNTPTITSGKFWPGALAHTSTHAVVLARLIILGKDYGIHPFMVQLRSLEDHNPLPGRKLGFIGKKMGYNIIDNGFLYLNNVKIPRDHLLMRYAQVSPDGKYTSEKTSSKISYITMVSIRAALVLMASFNLSKTCTIAIRYSAVRRQSTLKEGEAELQVLDYKTQQYSLFPVLATAFALWCTGNDLIDLFTQTTNEIKEGKFHNLQELHATSCGLKAFATQAAVTGGEICRMRCGGHGYLMSSGLADIYLTKILPGVTYEGENNVMLLQTARYLMKCCRMLVTGSELGSMPSYLSINSEGTQCPVSTINDLRIPHVLVRAFKHRAERLVKLAFNNLQSRTSQGMTPENAWNETAIDLLKAAMAHCHLYIVEAFAKLIENGLHSVSEELRTVLKVLFVLYSVHGIVENSGDFLEDQYMTSKQMRLANQLLVDLFNELRPNVVSLVDGFGFSDFSLASVLGRYDGHVYEHLIKEAEKHPCNKKKVLPTYEKYLRPLLKEGLMAKL